MALLTTFPSGAQFTWGENSSTPNAFPGERFVSADGRAYRYMKAGASNLVAGNLLQGPAENTAHQNLVPTAAAIGDYFVTVTLGASAVTENQYAGGLLVGSITPGNGLTYTILQHPAANGSATLQLELSEPISVALTSSSRVDLVANPFIGAIQNPTTSTGTVIGVAVNAITAGYYGLVQVGGLTSVLAQGALTVGLPVVASNGTAGAVEVAVGSSTETQPVVGFAATGVANTDNGAVFLTIS